VEAQAAAVTDTAECEAVVADATSASFAVPGEKTVCPCCGQSASASVISSQGRLYTLNDVKRIVSTALQEQDTRLRKTLRENNVTYKVYKNTMINFAIKGTEFEDLAKYLEGPTAIAVSAEDATAPARVICKFAKEAPVLEVKAGVVEGAIYDAKGIAQVASVPSREELLGKLLGSIQSPISNLARVLNQIAEKQGA